jgi:hypothetical protein
VRALNATLYCLSGLNQRRKINGALFGVHVVQHGRFRECWPASCGSPSIIVSSEGLLRHGRTARFLAAWRRVHGYGSAHLRPPEAWAQNLISSALRWAQPNNSGRRQLLLRAALRK